MTALQLPPRPSGYKTIAVLGVAWNSVCLMILLPIAIYGSITNPEKIPILKLLDLFWYTIIVPVAVALLFGSIGLLQNKIWARTVCLAGLTIDILFGASTDAIRAIVSVMNWGNDTALTLAVLPISILTYVLEGAILLYIKQKRVKFYIMGKLNAK